MPPIRKKTEKYRLAINVLDLERIPPPLLLRFILDDRKVSRLDTKKPVKVDIDRAQPSTAFVFNCDILTAALIVDMIRSENRKTNQPSIRIYIDRGRGWSRLPYTAILTRMVGDKSELNSEIFREKVEEEIEEGEPLDAERIY